MENDDDEITHVYVYQSLIDLGATISPLLVFTQFALSVSTQQSSSPLISIELLNYVLLQSAT